MGIPFMKRKSKLPILLFCFHFSAFSQSNNPAPYCLPNYAASPCSQSGPSNSSNNIQNDFIDSFYTSGATTNITNNNSGCNGLPSNYIYYCQHHLVTSPGQTITCNLKSGLFFPQSFAIFIDWNQNGQFDLPLELAANSTTAVPANTWEILNFVTPLGQANGNYRIRIRCAFTSGSNISPCGLLGYGETEDYNLVIGSIPPAGNNQTLTAVAPYTICSSQSLSLSASYTGSIPTSYNWTGPNNFASALQNPLIIATSSLYSGFYHVSVNTSTCPSLASTHVLVNTTPEFTITVSDSVFCKGTTVFLNALGSNTVIWTPSSIVSPSLVLTPSASIVYTAQSTSTANCTRTKTGPLVVLPEYTINIISSNTLLCIGQQANLAASGALFYAWSNGMVSSQIAFTPSTSTIYTVTGSGNLCTSTATIHVAVSPCIGMAQHTDEEEFQCNIENPFNTFLNIQTNKITQIIIFDLNGKILHDERIETSKKIDTAHLPPGLYFLTTNNGQSAKTIKVIKD